MSYCTTKTLCTRCLYLAVISALMLAAAAMLPRPALAQDTTPLTTNDLVSIVGQAVVEDAAQADERVRRAKDAYDAAMRSGTRQQQTEASGELEQATERSRSANARLDEARVEAIAEKSGRSPAEIRSMRESGMGWGAIANETGVHPSVNARGQAKGRSGDKRKGKDKDRDRDRNRTPDTDADASKTGKGKGRGAGADEQLPDADTGKGKAKSKGKGKQ
jgi:hypothetical protein